MSRGINRVAPALLAVGLALAPLEAGAAETSRHVAIRWNAPEPCPDDASAIRQIQDHLGQTLSSSSAQALRVDVAIQAGAVATYSAKLRFSGEQGVQERFLEHPSCDKLTEAAALLVALAIDPERVHADHEPTSTLKPPMPVAPSDPTVHSEPAPCLTVPARPSDAPTPAAVGAARYHALLALTAMGSAGALPSFGPGVGMELGLRRDRLRLALAGRYWAPRVDDVNEAPEAGVELSLVALGLRACAVPMSGDWSLTGCAAFDLGDMTGAGSGVSRSRERHALFSALGGSVAVAYSRLRLAPYLGFEAFANLSRPHFGVSIGGQAIETFRPAAWSTGAFLGVLFES